MLSLMRVGLDVGPPLLVHASFSQGVSGETKSDELTCFPKKVSPLTWIELFGICGTIRLEKYVFICFFFFFEGLFCKNSLFFLLRFVIFNIRCFYNIIFNLQRFLLKIIYHFI